MQPSVRPWMLVALLAAAAACDPGGGTQPSVPTSVTALSPLTQSAVTGTAVAEPPRVRVVDQRGAAMQGVTVSFAVTSGGGSVQNASATTDAEGAASAGVWTLGSAAGQQVLTATVSGLTPVQFAATAQARVPTSVVAVSAVTQTAAAGSAVADPPAVRVSDQTGLPLPGAGVTFAVTSGGGSLTGASAVTGADGVARVGSWTLGAAAGTNTLTATVTGLASVQFTAEGTPATDPCATAVAYTLFSTITGALSQTDCDLGGWYADIYSVSLPTAIAVTFHMTSTVIDSWLELYDAAGNILAINDDDDSQQTVNSALRVFAPSGNYFLVASSWGPGETGPYQISSTSLPGNENCLESWLVPGVVVNGAIAASDCNHGGYLADDYWIVLRPGQTLTVRLESSAFDAYLELFDSGGTLVAEDDDSAGGTNALLTFTAGQLDAYRLSATTFDTGETGAYTLTVTRN
jgi:hypothetical protein